MFQNIIAGISSKEIIDRNNRWFAFIFCLGLGVFGSVLTVMVIGAAATVFFLLSSGAIKVPENKAVWRVSQMFILFVGTKIFLSLYHFENMNGLLLIFNLVPFLAFLPIVSALGASSPAAMKLSIERGAAVGGIVAILFVVFELSNGAVRAEGGNGNPGPFVVAMSVAYAISLLGAFNSAGNTHRLLMIVGAGAAAACILASGMRGSWPVLILLPVIAAWSYAEKISIRTWMRNIAILTVALAVVLFVMKGIFLGRLAEISHEIEQIRLSGNYKNSLGYRIIIWEFSRTIFFDSIWLGHGEVNGLGRLADFSEANFQIRLVFTHLHNFILNAYILGGLLELTATFVLLLGPIIVLWKCRHQTHGRYGIALAVSIAAIYCTSGMFNKAFGHDILDSLFTYMLALATYFATSQLWVNQDTAELRS